MKSVCCLMILLLTTFLGNKSFATLVFRPEPDPIYKTDLEIQREIIKGKVYADKFVKPRILPSLDSHSVWTIKNSSSIPFYTLYPLKNGFEWKDFLGDGYIPYLKLTSSGYYHWKPYDGGWGKEQGEIMIRSFDYLAEKKELSKSPSGTITSLYTFKIAINKKISDLNIQLVESIRDYREFHFVFSGEPPPNLSIVKHEHLRGFPEESFF